MKKLILTLTTIFTLAIAAIGFAADGGDLNKEQRAAENFVAAWKRLLTTSLRAALTTP